MDDRCTLIQNMITVIEIKNKSCEEMDTKDEALKSYE